MPVYDVDRLQAVASYRSNDLAPGRQRVTIPGVVIVFRYRAIGVSEDPAAFTRQM